MLIVLMKQYYNLKYELRFQLHSISVFLGMLAKLQKATTSFM